MAQENPTVGRFAPSPSGRMHLGNAFSALIAWLAVRSVGGEMVLRQEDLDPQRCKREYADQIEADYRWLGLDWDRGGSAGGEIVAEGTPEQVAEVPGSFTGQYLKPLLEKDKLLQEKEQNK